MYFMCDFDYALNALNLRGSDIIEHTIYESDNTGISLATYHMEHQESATWFTSPTSLKGE